MVGVLTQDPDEDDKLDYDELPSMSCYWEPDKAKRCDACWLRMRWLVEIPRTYGRPSVEPGRFRLCGTHAENVLKRDHRAVAYAMKTEEPAA